MEKDYKVLQGSMLDILPTLKENSFDACITDPPYELGFMGKSWDNSGIAFQKETWEKVYRVLKNGAYLIAFGGSRTFHRIAVAIEDAGFEIRDTMMWLYGSGFPKSMNVGFAVDKELGQESIDTGISSPNARPNCSKENTLYESGTVGKDFTIKKANNKWSGYGTCLKPAFEPIIVARKPLDGTVANNCLKWGCGAINIDECRVGNEQFEITDGEYDNNENQSCFGNIKRTPKSYIGRFPANVITDGSDEVASGMPDTKSSGGKTTMPCIKESGEGKLSFGQNYKPLSRLESDYIAPCDEGSAMRYFYCAKASKKDRDEGLDMFENVGGNIITGRKEHSKGLEMENGKQNPYAGKASPNNKNFHPTVKPIELMQYLVRLFVPKGGVILEPFAGSGSTGKATMFENRERDANYKITMIELTPEYIPIIEARCDYALNKYEYDAIKDEEEMKATGQLSIFDFNFENDGKDN